MAPQFRGVHKLFACTLVFAAGLSACDRATPVESDLDPAFAPAPAPVVSIVDCNLTAVGGGNKSVQVAVKLSNGNPAPGAIVTLVSKSAGPQCYATASTPDGIVRFTKIAQGAQVFVSARDEVTIDVAKLEIIPPAIPGNLSIFDDSPSPGAPSRQVPMLLSGTACTTASALSWTNWSANYATPCIVPGPGLNLTVQFLPNAPTTELTLLDPDGDPLPDVIVAALSPWNFNPLYGTQTREQACAQAPWVDDCNDPYLSSGPALIQSVDLTDGFGFVSLSHSHADTNAEPIILEAIRVHDGLTFFGTITEGSGDVQMAPGMCTIATVEDVMDSSVPDVDIKYTQHSVGMTWPGTVPTPVNSALIVRAEVWATAAGGAGRYDLSWLVGTSPARSVRADFSIPSDAAQFCPDISWSGNGLSGVSVLDYCARSADQSDVPLGRTAYTLYFVVTGVTTPIVDAFYTLTTVNDGVDPSKSNNTRASISFNGDPNSTLDDTLNRTSCPVPVNNDGRFGTFRLGSNDGRFGTF